MPAMRAPARRPGLLEKSRLPKPRILQQSGTLRFGKVFLILAWATTDDLRPDVLIGVRIMDDRNRLLLGHRQPMGRARTETPAAATSQRCQR